MMKSLLQVLAYPFRKGPRRPLTLRRPAREKLGQNIVKPLGMESTDLKMFNRVARENNTLENAPLVIPGHLGDGNLGQSTPGQVHPARCWCPSQAVQPWCRGHPLSSTFGCARSAPAVAKEAPGQPAALLLLLPPAVLRRQLRDIQRSQRPVHALCCSWIAQG